MIRYVHHELRMAIAAWCALAITTAVVFAVRGSSLLRESWWDTFGMVAAVLVLCLALRATRVPVLGMVRELETALPRHVPYGYWPTDRFTLLQPQFHGAMLAFAAAPVAVVLPVSLLWEPYLIAGLLYMFLDPLSRGLVGARHERRHGVLLWLGRKGRDPAEYYYTPVTPRPPTRTATDGPPG
ncbi:hypothetical protein ABZ896_06505 [Streptomyces sp. NPDC047072]|uniref:hypothetical protein n=1 Tax=Streptomyces sp. NPDC047072 TaxID=3154809 RepID=UPI0033E90619